MNERGSLRGAYEPEPGETASGHHHHPGFIRVGERRAQRACKAHAKGRGPGRWFTDGRLHPVDLSPQKPPLTDELLRRHTDGGDPGDGLSALVEVLHKLHEEDPRAAHQAEHEAVAHEQGADQHPAPAPVRALGRGALVGLFGLHGGHDCGGGGHRNTSVTLGCRASSKHEACQTSQT